MGFLRRFRGGEDASQQVKFNVNYFARIRDDAVLQVVGEAYRQELVATARPPGPDDLPPGIPMPPAGHHKALVAPEPGNLHDRNAIGVYLWAGGHWALVGYLSRDDAARYQPLFRHLATTSEGSLPAVTCDAALTTEYGGTGVVLHLGTAGECAVELATDDRTPAAHPWAGKSIVYTGQNASTVYGIPIDRAAQIMLARWAGCDLLPRLTKKADALIVADRDELTANLQRAKEYGVEIVDEPDFMRAVGLDEQAVGRVSGRWAQG